MLEQGVSGQMGHQKWARNLSTSEAFQRIAIFLKSLFSLRNKELDSFTKVKQTNNNSPKSREQKPNPPLSQKSPVTLCWREPKGLHIPAHPEGQHLRAPVKQHRSRGHEEKQSTFNTQQSMTQPAVTWQQPNSLVSSSPTSIAPNESWESSHPRWYTQMCPLQSPQFSKKSCNFILSFFTL